MSAPITEDVVERYERLASEFHRETGLMAPGKDVPAAMDFGYADDLKARWRAWTEWLARRVSPPGGAR